MRASASLSLGRPRMNFRRLAELGISSSLSQFLYLYATPCIEYTRGNIHATRQKRQKVWSFFSIEKGGEHRMTHLFDPLVIRDITFANRVFVSPMCQYCSTDGYTRTTGISCISAAARWAVLDWCLPKPLQFFLRAELVRTTWVSGWTSTSSHWLESSGLFMSKAAWLGCSWRMPVARPALTRRG